GGTLRGTGVVQFTNDQGIWSERDGSGLTLVARTGDPAPGTAAGLTFSNLSVPVLNSSGQTAFRGSLTGTGVDSTNDRGIWSEGAGSGLALVAREGSSAPGTAVGVNFRGLGDPLLNSGGQLAFTGRLTGIGVDSTNDSGIWSEGAGHGLTLVARAGEAAADTAAGVSFSTFFFAPVLNSSGQTAFFGSLTGTGVDFQNDGGIWAEDSAGNLQLIVREGDLLDVSDDPLTPDERTIMFLGFNPQGFIGNTGNGDGRPSGFNDKGQLAFFARFTDGSRGIFVSNLVAVPEPSALALLLMQSVASVCLLRRGTSVRFSRTH
ncbi:MAG: DUF7453 family protein, partial [Bythopirellula sp.]